MTGALGALFPRGNRREERLYEFVEEARRSDADIEAGGSVYRAEDMHAWLKRLAQGDAAERPGPWRG